MFCVIDKELSPVTAVKDPATSVAPAPFPPQSSDAKHANQHRKKLLLSILRWTVAVVGIVWVLSKISLHDRAELLDAHNRPQAVTLKSAVGDHFQTIDVASPAAFAGVHSRSELVNHADLKTVTLIDGKSVNAAGRRSVAMI